MPDLKISQLPLNATPALTDEIPINEAGTSQKTKLKDVLAQEIITGTTAALPAAAHAGRVHFPTDGSYIYRDNGSAWKALGPLYPMEPPPTLGSWTAINQGTATLDDSHGAVSIKIPGSTTTQNFRLLVKTAPATPYSITVFFNVLFNGDLSRNPYGGFVWRNSGSGLFVSHGYYQSTSGSNAYGLNMTSATVFSANKYDVAGHYSHQTGYWFRFRDNGTTRFIDNSVDGYIWNNYSSNTHTDFMTPDQVGFCCNAYTTSAADGQHAGITLYHWKETASAAF